MGLFKKKEKDKYEEYKERTEEVGFGDRFAMWISGVLVIAIPCFIMICIVLLVTLFLFSGTN